MEDFIYPKFENLGKKTVYNFIIFQWLGKEIQKLEGKAILALLNSELSAKVTENNSFFFFFIKITKY